MRAVTAAFAAVLVLGAHHLVAQGGQPPFRTHTTTYAAPHFATAAEWAARKATCASTSSLPPACCRCQSGRRSTLSSSAR